MRHLFRVLAALVIFVYGSSVIRAQEAPAYAITNVTIHHSDGSESKSSSIVWRDGVIEAVGKRVTIPFDAFTIDGGDSLHLYPGLIDGLATWGSPAPPREYKPLPEPGNPPYDRAGVQPERKPSVLLESDDKEFEAAMKAGFTTAVLGVEGNMLPGQVETFFISPEETKTGLYGEVLGLEGSFETAPGGWSSGAYPGTLMGVMAKFRQTMYEAQALQTHIQYHSTNPEMPAPNRSEVLEALFPLINNTKPLYFKVDSKENIDLLLKLQDEFGFDAVIVSGKEAHARAGVLKQRGIPVLASIDTDDAPKWYTDQKKKKKDDDAKEEEITDEEKQYREKQLEAWKEEVTNIKSLIENGVKVGYSSHGLALKDFAKKLEVIMDEGELEEDDLLALMTINTAEIIGLNGVFGSLEKGKNASFTLVNKPIFEKKASVVKSVSNGTIYEF